MLHQVGVGALGPVFRTYEPTRDRLVAVKVFRLDIIPEQAQALADALSRATEAGLFHPSIVEPIAAGLEGTVAYRAEEYVAAESLDVAMRHYAPAPIEKALPYVTQLAGALDFARAAGVGHGGLHPRDIFITPDEARATGFGVVEALEQVGIRAPVRRPYSAPERIAGEAWGIAADVFALAAITFELLTARRPAGTGAEIGAVPDSPHAAAVHAVLARAMAEDPGRRYGSALTFAGALESAWRGDSQTDAVAMVESIAKPQDVRTAEPAPAVSASLFDDEPVEDVRRDDLPGMHAEIPAARVIDDAVDREEAAPEPVRALPGEEYEMGDDEREGRFADDFVDEQADAEERRPLEAEGEAAEPYALAVDEPVARGPEFGYGAQDHEHSRSGILPHAITAVLCLLIGFGGGYLLRGRAIADQSAAPSAPPAAASPQSSVPPTSPGREFSDQAVNPAAARPPAQAPPPVTETPSPSRPTALPVAPPASREPAAMPPPVVARRGQLLVHSVPPKAGVTVNGQWRGRTPLKLDDLPFGQYIVRVVQPGYRIAHEEFALGPRAATHTVSVRLETDRTPIGVPAHPPAARGAAPAESPSGEVAFAGSIYVDSRPQGANVLLDGNFVGKTPLRLSDVRIGLHVVRLDLAEHHPWSSTARVVAGQEARVTASLERIQ